MKAPLHHLLHRRERKMLVLRGEYSWIKSLIRLHPLAFREAYPPRVINNVYLDTMDMRHYWDSVNGTSRRYKTRIRWYAGLEGEIDQPIFQRKHRDNIASLKEEMDLNPLQVRRTVTWKNFMAGVLKNNKHAAKLLDPTEFPCLINQYSRDYYLSACGRFRLTTDYRMLFFQQLYSGRINLDRALNSPSYVIVEIKYLPEHDPHLAPITNHLPFRLTKSSKYVTGMNGGFPV